MVAILLSVTNYQTYNLKFRRPLLKTFEIKISLYIIITHILNENQIRIVEFRQVYTIIFYNNLGLI